MYAHEFRAMNTNILVAVEGLQAELAIKVATKFIEVCEQRFTRFEETSELSALNRSAGDWFTASPEMFKVLTSALDCYKATGGLFDPSILPDLKAAGYTRSFEHALWRTLGPKPVSTLRSLASSFSSIQLDPVHNRVRLPTGMQIDLGGIAKGWIAEKAAQLMVRFSPACAVNAGGDMFLIGQPHGQAAWEIELEDPSDPTQDLMTLFIDEGAVATSSVVKRSWFQGDVKRHHLIDPRNGEPADTHWLSVTVFAPKAVVAETFAKALLIAGPGGAQSLLDNNSGISFLAVDDQKQIWKSPTEKEKIYEYA